ncbi:MAG TPA: hypothetical protein VIX17_14140 [Pyrinomonadaceae bacterium]
MTLLHRSGCKLMSVDIDAGSSFEPGKPKVLFDITAARTTMKCPWTGSAFFSSAAWRTPHRCPL